MRVAELDMTNSSHQCPSGLMQRIYSGKCTCVRIETAGGCSSANNFITPGVKYSNVCGRVIGYQYGSTNAFIGGTSISADSRYVDGVRASLMDTQDGTSGHLQQLKMKLVPRFSPTVPALIKTRQPRPHLLLHL